MSEHRLAAIRKALEATFEPIHLAIDDDSHLHAGHAGAKEGKGHFSVRITAEAFSGQSLIKRHRALYAALGELMETEIHALAIDARAPEE